MAHVKMSYIIQSCPVCQKKLLKVAAGSVIIGSPLLTCKNCGRTYRTELRTEWYKFPTKWMLWGLPLIIFGIGLLVGLFMGEDFAVGLIAAFFGLIVGLCITIKDVVRMLQSKKRMKDPAYLELLLQHGVLSQTEHEEFMRKAGGKATV